MEHENKANSVPYIVYEGEMSRNERLVKRLVIALLVTVVLLFLTNFAWLKAWTEYDYVSEELTTSVDVNAENGVANYIGNDGDIINGENTSNENAQNPNSDAQGRQE